MVGTWGATQKIRKTIWSLRYRPFSRRLAFSFYYVLFEFFFFFLMAMTSRRTSWVMVSCSQMFSSLPGPGVMLLSIQEMGNSVRKAPDGDNAPELNWLPSFQGASRWPVSVVEGIWTRLSVTVLVVLYSSSFPGLRTKFFWLLRMDTNKIGFKASILAELL